MLAELVAVCLIGVSEGEVHHKRGHHNYGFRDYVCSQENMLAGPDSCGKLNEFFEDPKAFYGIPIEKRLTILPTEVISRWMEFYKMCCLEA